MFRKLTFANIKGRSASVALDVVTVFTGPHKSGKTAAMESARMALAGSCSFGTSNAKLAELVAGKAGFVEIEGDEYSATLEIKCGQRVSVTQNILDTNGTAQHVDAIVAKLPVTGKEFWTQSGEDKWTVLESVVGKFTQPEPPSLESIVERIARTRSLMQPPTAYTGPSIESLQSRVDAVDTLAREVQAAMKYRKYKEQSLASAQRDLAASQTRLDGHAEAYTQASHNAAAILNDKPLLHAKLEQWQAHPLRAMRSTAKTLREVYMEAICDSLAQQTAVMSLLDSSPLRFIQHQLVQFITQMAEVIPVDPSPILDAPIALPPCFHELKSLYAAWGLATTDSESMASSFDSLIDNANLRAQSLRNTMETTRLSIAQVSDKIRELESEIGDVVDDSEVTAQLTAIAPVREQLDQARTWQAWQTTSAQHAATLAKLEAELLESKNQVLAWKTARNDYLLSSLGAVSAQMNSILVDMNWPVVKLDVATAGKRQSLIMSTEGGARSVDAMAGSEQVVYGAILVHALQMLSRAKCPVLFIEAAELCPEEVNNLIAALAPHRMKGNVFISHYGATQLAPSSLPVTTTQFDASTMVVR